MTYKNIHKLCTFLSFLIPLIIYCITMAPTTSFWDCGEYIATSRILGVPHPPGSPFFLLLGNFFSSLPLFKDIGARVNFISPLASAFSVMFLYLIIVYLIEEIKGKVKTISDSLMVYCSAFIAALTFAVTDAHWFNAVEAEVYSVSTFFTSIVAWMILKWSRNNDNTWNIRYLLIIIYMFGLAIGVHLLNLLTLPFVSLIIYFKKFRFNLKTFLITILITLLIFVTIYSGIIKGIPEITSKSNSLLFVILFPILIIVTILVNSIVKINKTLARTFSVLSLVAILTILSNSLFISSTETISYNKYNDLINFQSLIDQSDQNIFTMNQRYKEQPSYQTYDYQQEINEMINNRNQLVENYKTKYNDYLNFEKTRLKFNYLDLIRWQPKSNLFIILFLFTTTIFFYFRFSSLDYTQTKSILNFLFSGVILIVIGYSTYTMVFIRSGQHPNINENSPDTINRALSYMNRDQYGDWQILDWGATLARGENTNWKRYTLNKNDPTQLEKFTFFIKYQINEMYFRYFAWQFIGRGEKEQHPWYIKDLENNLIGNQKLDGINWFRYGLPLAFIVGLLGMIFHFSQDWRRALAVLSFFLATGLMIIIYLNQYDPQPRERDYSYVGSFFAFSIWIGIGLSAMQDYIRKFFKYEKIASFISISILSFSLILMPITIFAKDFKQHNRSNNYVAWDYGYNLLNSCEPDGIIFTNGDNDTFPLWYLQEVEGIRKDVKVVNLSLLNTAWYIDQLMYQEPTLDLKFVNEEIKNDIYKIDPWSGTELAFNLCGETFIDEKWDRLQCNLKIDNNELNFILKPTLIGKLLRVQDALILKIITDVGKNKPIYFAATVSQNNQLGLNNYLQMEGMTYRLLFNKKESDINYNKMYQNLQEAKKEIIITKNDYINAVKSGDGIYRYTNLNDTTIYYNDNIKRLVQNYRIGFIRLAEDKLSLDGINNEIEIEALMDSMNYYFPNQTLPIEPGIQILISDSIYGVLNNTEEQKNILVNLFNENIPLETKIYLLHKIAKLEDKQLIIHLIKQLIYNNSNDIAFDLQKYIGDIASDYLTAQEFISLCNTIFNDHKLVGLLYTMVRVLEENGLHDDALKIVQDWLSEDTLNQDLLLLEDYLKNSNQIY